MTNYEIADHFSLLSKLMDIHGENAFKTKSYSNAAYAIEQLHKQIDSMSEAELYRVRGIGQAIGEKIRVLQQTGKLPLLQEYLDTTPTGVIEMLQIKGFGPKKIGTVWKELGIETIGELEYACGENRLAALRGFGAKTQQNICDAIAFYRQSQGFHLWAEVEEKATALVQQFRVAFPQNRFDITGAMRRQMETVEAIEIACDLEQDDLIRGYEAIEGVSLETVPADRLTVRIPGQPTIRFYLADAKGYYATLFRSTGSDEFMEAFHEKYVVPEAAESETEIFTANGLQAVPPAIRELPKILEQAAAHSLNELITVRDIRGIIHSHSTWSDGAHTLEEMARGAIDQGYEYLVISDHSQAAFYAGGLTPQRIKDQHSEIDKLNEKLAPFRIFKSIEADILSDGELDYNAEILSSFDLVIASVHSNLKMPLEKAMDRLLAAIRNPFTTILGHPTGRLLLSREGYPVDHKRLIDTCAAHDVVIEINAHPRRLDVDWRWVDYALEKGVMLSINPDAHSVQGFKDVYYGVLVGQKGGLTKKDNLSSLGRTELEQWLQERKKVK